MTEENLQVNYAADDEIDLSELWGILWGAKWLVLGITCVFAIGSVTFALVQTEIYRSEALLAPAESRQSNNSMLGQLGAAANIVGISVGNQAGDQINTAIAILRSREFARQFIENHDLLPQLMAGVWSEAENRSIIDSKIYDIENEEWLGQKPSNWEAVNKFRSILAVTRNQDTGLITVAVEWHDPIQAQRWVNRIVSDVNNRAKQHDLEEASNAIDYLRQQLQSTQLVEMQRIFNQLIESQTRVVMLADVRDEYVFRVIDAAVVPEERVSPNRAAISILGTLLGGFLAIVFVFLRQSMKSGRRIS